MPADSFNLARTQGTANNVPVHPAPTASEALYAFMGWLTTRKQIAVFSSNHDAALAVELAKEFCDANKLPEPRENWAEIWEAATR